MKSGLKEKLELYELFIKRKLYWWSRHFVDEKSFIKFKHKIRLGEDIDLINPQTFNDKIQWLKLYDKKDDYTICADKYRVREYVEQRVGTGILNDLYGVYDCVEDIDIAKLPESFVLKVTHGCGQNIICRNKLDVDWPFAFKSLNLYLQLNHYYHGKEWAYKNIKPRIICEKYLEEDGHIPHDYKLFCFNGNPKIIQVDIDRFTAHKRNLYDLNWNFIDVKYTYPRSPFVEKPENLQDMLELAKMLAKGFPFVRIDFYSVKKRIIFGEMTFYPDSGSNSFIPNKFNADLGAFLKMPNAKTT